MEKIGQWAPVAQAAVQRYFGERCAGLELFLEQELEA
jgi:hypothetical protein